MGGRAPVRRDKGVVVHGAAQHGAAEARAELKPLGRRQGEHCMRQLGLEAIEDLRSTPVG